MASSGEEVPLAVCVFTCWVCTGIMANFTVILPLTVYYEGPFYEAALVISSYAVGALGSLTFWSRYNRRAVKAAYLTHAMFMIVGNSLFASYSSKSWMVYLARFIIGLEGGCMYNANLALVTRSSEATRVKYLAYYQSYVGLGLVLGPAISASAVAVSTVFDAPYSRDTYTGVFMATWGGVLLIALLALMPPDDDDDDDDEDDEGGEGGEWFAFAGNFWRIFQRLAWETGAVLILSSYFGWGAVAAGYTLAAFGAAQAVAQALFGPHCDQPVFSLRTFEVIELVGVLGMFGKTPATHDWRTFFNVTFVAFGLAFYVGSCLTSAPFNGLVLARGRNYERTLLASQYGIFTAFLTAPLAARGTFALDTPSPSAIAGLLVVGWACQSLVNASLLRSVDSALIAGLGLGLAACITWAALDRVVGGTGKANVFSYHPVFMALAFFCCMTNGQLVYRPDAAFLRLTEGLAPAELRKSHAAWMAAAFVLALAGYFAIFAAHAQSGESQIGLHESWSRTLHVALGYPTLAWLLLQTLVGLLKARTLVVSARRSFAWHGASGTCLLLAAYVTATLGVWLRMNYDRRGGWGLPIKLLFTGVALFLFGARALFPRPHQPTPRKPSDAFFLQPLVAGTEESKHGPLPLY